MREIFKVKLKAVSEVSVIWVSLSKKMPNKQLSNNIFTQTIEKWIDLRAYAYVTAFVQILKTKINSLTKDMKEIYSVKPIKKSRTSI